MNFKKLTFLLFLTGIIGPFFLSCFNENEQKNNVNISPKPLINGNDIVKDTSLKDYLEKLKSEFNINVQLNNTHKTIEDILLKNINSIDKFNKLKDILNELKAKDIGYENWVDNIIDSLNDKLAGEKDDTDDDDTDEDEDDDKDNIDSYDYLINWLRENLDNKTDFYQENKSKFTKLYKNNITPKNEHLNLEFDLSLPIKENTFIKKYKSQFNIEPTDVDTFATYENNIIEKSKETEDNKNKILSVLSTIERDTNILQIYRDWASRLKALINIILIKGKEGQDKNDELEAYNSNLEILKKGLQQGNEDHYKLAKEEFKKVYPKFIKDENIHLNILFDLGLAINESDIIRKTYSERLQELGVTIEERDTFDTLKNKIFSKIHGSANYEDIKNLFNDIKTKSPVYATWCSEIINNLEQEIRDKDQKEEIDFNNSLNNLKKNANDNTILNEFKKVYQSFVAKNKIDRYKADLNLEYNLGLPIHQKASIRNNNVTNILSKAPIGITIVDEDTFDTLKAKIINSVQSTEQREKIEDAINTISNLINYESYADWFFVIIDEINKKFPDALEQKKEDLISTKKKELQDIVKKLQKNPKKGNKVPIKQLQKLYIFLDENIAIDADIADLNYKYYLGFPTHKNANIDNILSLFEKRFIEKFKELKEWLKIRKKALTGKNKVFKKNIRQIDKFLNLVNSNQINSYEDILKILEEVKKDTFIFQEVKLLLTEHLHQNLLYLPKTNKYNSLKFIFDIGLNYELENPIIKKLIEKTKIKIENPTGFATKYMIIKQLDELGNHDITKKDIKELKNIYSPYRIWLDEIIESFPIVQPKKPVITDVESNAINENTLAKSKKGLYNVGNTCFMNTALHVLYNCLTYDEKSTIEEIINHLKGKKKYNEIWNQLTKLIKENQNSIIQEGDLKTIIVNNLEINENKASDVINQLYNKSLYNILTNMHKEKKSIKRNDLEYLRLILLEKYNYREGSEQDAIMTLSQFLNIISALIFKVDLTFNYKTSDFENIIEVKTHFNKKLKQKALKVDKLFNGLTQEKDVCLECFTSYYSLKVFNMKVIPVIENTNLTFEKKFESLNVLSNIGQSLNKFSQMKILPGNSYYLYCTTCKKQSDRTAHQETHLKYPKVIILNLDRFKTGLGIAEGKRNHLINYEAKRKFGKHKYELIAVIIHDGNTPRHGHYTAYIKDFASQLWFYANDNIIRTVSAQEVINHKDAIGLVYKKKKKE